jgi:hypothetical protein
MGMRDLPKDDVTLRRFSHVLYAQKASPGARHSTVTNASIPATVLSCVIFPSAAKRLLRTTTRRGTRRLTAVRKLSIAAGLVRMDRLGVAVRRSREKMGFWSTTIRPSEVGSASRGGTRTWSWGKMDEAITKICRWFFYANMAASKRPMMYYTKLLYSSCHAVNMLGEVLEPPQTTITTLSSGCTGLPRALSSLPP